MNSKFKHHSAPVITLPQDMVMYLTLWSIMYIRFSRVIIFDLLESNHLPIVLHILDRIKTKNLLEPVEKSQTGSSFKALPLI
jgi:hypothetical protein